MREIIRDAEKNKLLIRDSLDGNKGFAKSDFREKMLVNNNIDGILGFKVYVTDNIKTFEYDTSGLGNLESFCQQNNADVGALKGLLKGIVGIVQGGRKYMLEENDFVLRPEYIFINGEQPYVAYCPGYNKPISEQMAEISEYLMNRVDYHNQEAVILTYTVYMKCREEGFSLEGLMDYLDGKDDIRTENRGSLTIKSMGRNIEESDRDVITVDRASEHFMDNYPDRISDWDENSKIEERISKKAYPRKKTKYIYLASALCPILLIAGSLKLGILKSQDGRTDMVKLAAVVAIGLGIAVFIIKKARFPEKNGKLDFDAENVKLGYDEATELLFDRGESQRKEEKYVLESEDYPEIRLAAFPFYIGKDAVHMDYCLDCAGVSRHHVKIERGADGLEIWDLNSTNGTYINNERLQSNVAYPLHAGDSLTIGVATYTFSEK